MLKDVEEIKRKLKRSREEYIHQYLLIVANNFHENKLHELNRSKKKQMLDISYF